MITVRGQGQTAAELPVARAAARTYFADVPAFLRQIEAVDGVKPIAGGAAYLITHHPVGGFGYEVVVVAVLEHVWDGHQMRLVPRDFDLDKVKGPHAQVKGFIEGTLTLDERAADRTAAAFSFALTVEIPVPGVLSLVPRPLLQTTADGLMTLKSGLVVRSLFQKVLADFQLPANAG